jgi:hypothetical protein
LGTTSPFNTVQSYNVTSATTGVSTSGSFTVNLGAGGPSGNQASNANAFTPNNFTVNESGSVTTPSYSIGGTGNQTVTINSNVFLAGDHVYIQFTSGSLLGAGYDGVYTIANGTGGNTSTNCTISLASSPPGTVSGNVLIPRLTGGYTVTTAAGNSTITLQTANNFDLKATDSVWVDFLVTISPLGAPSQMYTVSAVPGNNLVTVQAPTVLTAGTESTNGMVAYPQTITNQTRQGTVNVDFSTWNINNTTTNSTLNQSPLDATTVFNYFYPSYEYSGPVSHAGTTAPTFPLIAQAGMTTPEFQMTDASDTLNLTNAVILGILNAGNTFGYTSFFSGGGAIVMDFNNPNQLAAYQYMTDLWQRLVRRQSIRCHPDDDQQLCDQ